MITIANTYFHPQGVLPWGIKVPTDPLGSKKRQTVSFNLWENLPHTVFTECQALSVLRMLTHIILRKTPQGRYFNYRLLLQMGNWGMESSGSGTCHTTMKWWRATGAKAAWCVSALSQPPWNCLRRRGKLFQRTTFRPRFIPFPETPCSQSAVEAAILKTIIS